jgi:DNA-directed RNA polymerase subunit RPC12/RpoP
MIKFSCPKCSKTLKAPPEKAGRSLPCPSCGEKVVVPSEYATVPTESNSNTKACPFCAEPIHRDAIKCKHCGEFLEKKSDDPIVPESAPKTGFEWEDKEERTYYNQSGVRVTSTRFIFRDRTFSMANITSVTSGKEYIPIGCLPWAIWAICFFAVTGFGSKLTQVNGMVWAAPVFFILFMGVSVVVYRILRNRTIAYVTIRTTGGDSQRLETSDGTIAVEIAQAVNSAMIARQ